MDRDTYALFFELIKSALGLFIIIFFGDWFLISDYFSSATIIIQTYFITSLLIVFYFSYFEKNQLSYSKE